ncbi:hypothetical protein FGO68_gene13944 [Halteria grandinella]|uniref:Uncharacterized protein n=1 Tax=Halteria grandinella TaxID=5974 RepID=A0A8J8T2W0_HALGN|nr:hypothetical protein FGO68_gene13944 [Halteria grandinella]
MKSDICVRSDIVRYEHSGSVLQNWITRLGLECVDSYKIGLFGTLSFCGEVMSNFVLPPISDKYGRKFFTILGSTIQLTVYTLMLFSTSLTMTYCLMPFFGVTCSIRYCITYSHLMELYPPSKASSISAALFFLDGSLAVLCPLVLLATMDTNWLLIMGVGVNVGCLGLAGYIRPGESVKLLVTLGRYDEAKGELRRTKGFNGESEAVIEEGVEMIERYRVMQSQSSAEEVKEGKVDLKVRWWNMGMMVVCWVAVCYSYFLFVFFIKYLPADIYVVSIVSGLSTFGYLLQGPITTKYDIKMTQLISFVLVTLCLIITTIVGSLLNTYVYAIFILILKLFVCLAFGTVYVVHLDLFDSSFLGTSYGICNVVSRLVIISAPMVAEMENKSIPMLILLGMNLTATIATWFLKKKKTD